MKKLIALVLIMCSVLITAQEKDVVDSYQENNRFYFALRLNLGPTVIPNYGQLSSSLNIQFRKKNLRGIGFDFSAMSYESPNYTDTPAPERIQFYDYSRESVPRRVLVNGKSTDNIMALSFYYSVGFKASNRLVFDFQAGPSLTWLEERTYTYRYAAGGGGGFATFFGGGGGPSIWVEGIGQTAFSVGGYFRASMQARIWDRTVIEFGPLVLIHPDQSSVSLQIGIVFGRKYKDQTLN
ncbi:MAG: hypothetical protein ABJM06_00525 [Gilvibacter sp.]